LSKAIWIDEAIALVDALLLLNHHSVVVAIIGSVLDYGPVDDGLGLLDGVEVPAF
jgi:hypothetical protein